MLRAIDTAESILFKLQRQRDCSWVVVTIQSL